MDFALAHNVRGVTLTRPTGDGGDWMEKGLNHRTVKSSQRSLARTLALTDRERGREQPSTLSRGQGQAVCLCSQRCLWFVPVPRRRGVSRGREMKLGQNVALGIRASFGHLPGRAFSHLSFVILIIPFYYLHHYQCPDLSDCPTVCLSVCMSIYIYIDIMCIPLIIRHL